jgi:hypothetical protein
MLSPNGTELHSDLPASIGGLLSVGTITIPDLNNITFKDQICLILGDHEKCDKWMNCCQDAEKCCESQMADYSETTIGGDMSLVHCHGLWDGSACWPRAKPGQQVLQVCPQHSVTCQPKGKNACFLNSYSYNS